MQGVQISNFYNFYLHPIRDINVQRIVSPIVKKQMVQLKKYRGSIKEDSLVMNCIASLHYIEARPLVKPYIIKPNCLLSHVSAHNVCLTEIIGRFSC